MRTVIYPVKDQAQAKTPYGRLLGVEPDMDEPYYVGFSVEGQHIGLDPHGHSKGMPGPVGCWHVDDIEASVKLLLDAGAQVQERSAMSVAASWSHPCETRTATSSDSSRHPDHASSHRRYEPVASSR